LNPVRDSGAPLLPEIMQNEDENLISDLRNLRDRTIPYPQQGTDPLSEYNTPNLFSMALPTLFPTGRGDMFGTDPDRNKRTFVSKIQSAP
jgi:hypothetical protein